MFNYSSPSALLLLVYVMESTQGLECQELCHAIFTFCTTAVVPNVKMAWGISGLTLIFGADQLSKSVNTMLHRMKILNAYICQAFCTMFNGTVTTCKADVNFSRGI